MQDDVLRFVIGPSPYAASWLWFGLALLAVVAAWWVGVVLWTLPTHRLRTIPVIRAVHSKLLRRRFSRSILAIDQRYRADELTAAQAGHQMSRALRSFLYHATGTPAQYMHVEAIKTSDIAEAATVFAALNDSQFNSASQADISEIGVTARELILSWP